ncbi:hypothetical protein AXF42_Ash000106 [Apostasia shenzhenica]|uniref:Uncharacterized protein n=1 Tax=Apostasia shenzhenica TaxID=1088818 RepID=A0A2I0AFF8_9ASPA|nr:hypothetical protein AXF42_Ash000106 [Apostasia shenzhenica]
MASEQQGSRRQRAQEKGMEELPLESSPYVKYTDLEDYKQKGYGTQGHHQPVENRRTGGATEAPTLSGSGLSPAEAGAADAMNRLGAV